MLCSGFDCDRGDGVLGKAFLHNCAKTLKVSIDRIQQGKVIFHICVGIKPVLGEQKRKLLLYAALRRDRIGQIAILRQGNAVVQQEQKTFVSLLLFN